MGTDIHMNVEVRLEGQAQWQLHRGQRRNWRTGEWVGEGVRIFDNRRYHVFAVLADVRQYSEQGRLPVIAEPRGLPPDLSTELLEALVKDEEGDPDDWQPPWERGYDVSWDHSLTWLAASELTGFDWDQQVQYFGFRAPLREVMEPAFMDFVADLEVLSSEAEVRIVFGFDS